MLRYVEEVGWRYASYEKALRLRGDERGRIFADVLTARLHLNSGVVDAMRIGEIVRQFGLLNPTIEGNRDALA